MSSKFNVNRRLLAIQAKTKRYKKQQNRDKEHTQHKRYDSVGNKDKNVPYESSSESSYSDEECSDTETEDEDGEQEESTDYCVGGYHPVKIGDVFLNRYHVTRKLGWGHFSTVWLTWDLLEKKFTALKIVKSASHFAEAAVDEIKILKEVRETDLNDPKRNKTVQLLNDFKISGVNGLHICMIFEVLGSNLLKLIIKSKYKGIPLNNVKCIIRQVLEGLQYLHDKCHIIHTDIKPENILLCVTEEAVMKMACEAAQMQLNTGMKLPNSLVSAAPQHEEKMSKNKRKKLKKKYRKHIQLIQSELQHLHSIVNLKKTSCIDLTGTSVSSAPLQSKMETIDLTGDTDMSDGESNAASTLFSGKAGAGEASDFVMGDQSQNTADFQSICTKMAASNNDLLNPALDVCSVDIKIADLGNACYVNRHFSEEIQTRQYRSLEVLMGGEYNTTADIWSTACMAFELATGDYLFEPHSSEHYSRDEDHLAHIIELLGEIPAEIVRSGKFSHLFFDSNNKLKHIYGIKRWRLENVLHEKYSWKKSDAVEFASFLIPMLNFDPNRRASAAECLKHPWFQTPNK
ncbi:unnamed protein product [Brassicogethes aeneus]|uniref:non-specific serine/threonine protein kinase n=1 Tax=Brassicogethes aeneus TaxID=1431903 RepID=A0A9P0BAT6_BRAAE|nr:unnamed protein product [Brassicogethes aeneus]